MASEETKARLRAKINFKNQEEAFIRQDSFADFEALVHQIVPLVPELPTELVAVDGVQWFIIHCSAYVFERVWNIGPFRPARLVIASNGHYTFESLMQTIERGSWKDSERPGKLLHSLFSRLGKDSNFTLCPGLVDYETEFGDYFHIQPKHLRIWTAPVSRHDADACKVWHVPNNSLQPPGTSLHNVCIECKLLYQNLQVAKRRILEQRYSPARPGE